MMEKYRCKLCFRSFVNGRALGGHMRSHMMNFYAANKASKKEKEEHPFDVKLQGADDFYSIPSYSSTSEEEEEEEEVSEEENGLLSSSFAAGSVVLQDTESETESSKKNPTCRRSKRVRKSRISDFDRLKMDGFFQVKKPNFGKEGKTNINEFSSFVEAEPLSSISDTTPEEDVAYCLIMLSRDKWKRDEIKYQVQEEEEKENEKEKKFEDDSSEDSGVVKVIKTKVRGKYRCETCNKLFRSYQALGGHRANHKKIKVNTTQEGVEIGENGNAGGGLKAAVEEKIHECPFCPRVFASGQALGGHKRSHFIGAGAISSNFKSISPVKPFSRIGGSLKIDLNLPAPIDDDDEISQIAHSAVSDAELVQPRLAVI